MQYTHGGDIYTFKNVLDFSVNINPFGPSKQVLDAAKQAMEKIDAYPDSRVRKLRAVLAKQICVPEDQLIFGNGAAEVIFNLVLSEKPKKAWIAVPTFSEYEQALRTVDCRIQYYERKEKDGFQITETMFDTISDDIDMIFLCSPDNPTGVIADQTCVKKLIQFCGRKKIRLVIDESFIDFTDGTHSHIDWIQENPWLFLLRSFTKMHGIPGLRLGYGISSDRVLLEEMEKMRQPWSVSIPAEAAGVAAVKEEDRVRRTKDFIVKERAWMEEELKKLNIQFFPSQANYILLKYESDLFQLLLKEGILIRDCSNYRGLGKGFYRIAIRKREENEILIRALSRIKRR